MTRTALLGLAALALLLSIPAMAQDKPAEDEEGWVSLIGEDLTGWKLRHDGEGKWVVEDGMLRNTERAIDLVTEEKFGSCELHVEFRVPEGSNSGVYVQGRYEVQVADTFGADPSPGVCGGVWATAAPSENAAKPAGEWQTFDITFIAPETDDDGNVTAPARITVVHNDVTVVDDVEAPKATGGQLDNDLGEPGPLMLQGDHGPIDFRNIRIRPID